jgi:hypothetical protein
VAATSLTHDALAYACADVRFKLDCTHRVMLFVYFFLKNFDEIRSLIDIDLSTINSDILADECDRIMDHHSDKKVFLGYLEPGWMLDPKHDARIRRFIRKFDVYMVSMFPESLSFSWKNEIKLVYLESAKNGPAKVINDGNPVQSECQAEHGNSSGTTGP